MGTSFDRGGTIRTDSMTSPTKRSVPVELSLGRHDATRGVAQVVEHSALARVRRALLGWAATWSLAVLAVFIPILHFVLVPALLVTGVVLAIVRLREGATLAALEGACPRCKAPRRRENLGRFHDGRAVHCDGCGEQIQLRVCTEAAVSRAQERTNP